MRTVQTEPIIRGNHSFSFGSTNSNGNSSNDDFFSPSGCSKVFQTRTRFLMMILCLLCLASVWSNILCFNFALICIDENGKNESGQDYGEHDRLVQHLLGDNSLNDKNVTFSVSGGRENFTTYGNHTADRLSMVPSLTPTSIENNGEPMESKYHPSLPEATKNSSPKAEKISSREQLYLTSAVAAAALISNFLIVSLVNNYGIRTIFAVLGWVSAIATCLLPTAIELGFYYVLACRILQGVAFSANFPVIGAFTSKWTYYKQNGLFVSVLVAYVQFAPAITMPVSGALCFAVGWPSVFYAHGCVAAVLFTLFLILFRNSPGKHPFVGEVELRKIAIGKSEIAKETMKRIPLWEILKTPSVWAIWIAAIGNFVCVNMMFLYTPVYLKAVLHFPVAHAGFSASLAPLAQFAIKLFAGFTSDKIRFLSETDKLRLYNSIAFFGSSLFLTFLAFFPTEFSTICVFLLGISAGLLGFTTGGFFKAGPLVAKHYALVVMGQISLAITITLLFVPAMVNMLASDNSPEGWRHVFLFTVAVLCITNIVFCLMTSAKPAEWTTDDFSRTVSNNRIYSVETSTHQPSGAGVPPPLSGPNTMHIKQFATRICT